MRTLLSLLLTMTLSAAPGATAAAQEAAPSVDSESRPAASGADVDERQTRTSMCVQCHGDPEHWTGDTLRFYVTPEHLAGDIHWQKGLRCHDCHGGDPTSSERHGAQTRTGGGGNALRTVEAPGDVAGFCGYCHSNIETMRRYRPSLPTDQEAKYRTSGHGLRLEQSPSDTGVATCVSCHGRHDTRAVGDLQSRVYPTRLAKTCAACHSDKELMAGRQYHGRPLRHDQYDQWKTSVHAQLLLKENNLSAPTCNDCHGDHGAIPPEADSVANVCGVCHVKVVALFANITMKHRFEQADWGGLPGCAVCHDTHGIRHPTDKMLGMQAGAVCAKCHREGQFGATLTGAEEARKMAKGLVQLLQEIQNAEEKLNDAEKLGMEVSTPRYELIEARNALTNARSLIHGFSIEKMQEALRKGLKVAGKVENDTQKELDKYKRRRVWLAWSLVPIFVIVGLLLLYIRELPIPGRWPG